MNSSSSQRSRHSSFGFIPPCSPLRRCANASFKKYKPLSSSQESVFYTMYLRKKQRQLNGAQQKRKQRHTAILFTILVIIYAAGASFQEGLTLTVNVGIHELIAIAGWMLLAFVVVALLGQNKFIVILTWMVVFWPLVALCCTLFYPEGESRPWIGLMLIISEVISFLIFLFTYYIQPWALQSIWFRRRFSKTMFGNMILIRGGDIRVRDAHIFAGGGAQQQQQYQHPGAVTYRSDWTMTYSHRFLNSYTCKYEGETNAKGLPHGMGRWLDDSYHGEVYRGLWYNGKPIGPYLSREYGTGNTITATRIAFFMATDDSFTSQRFNPTNYLKPRIGVASVECCIFGSFFHDMPNATPIYGPHVINEMIPDDDSGIDNNFDYLCGGGNNNDGRSFDFDEEEIGIASIGECCRRLVHRISAEEDNGRGGFGFYGGGGGGDRGGGGNNRAFIGIATEKDNRVKVLGHVHKATGLPYSDSSDKIVINVVRENTNNNNANNDANTTRDGIGTSSGGDDDNIATIGNDSIVSHYSNEDASIYMPITRNASWTQTIFGLTMDDDDDDYENFPRRINRSYNDIFSDQSAQAAADGRPPAPPPYSSPLYDGRDSNGIAGGGDNQENGSATPRAANILEFKKKKKEKNTITTITTTKSNRVLYQQQQSNASTRSNNNIWLNVEDWVSNPHKEALIYFPGFNQCMKEALETLGQFIAMTKLSSHVYPICYAWPGGMATPWSYHRASEAAASERNRQHFVSLLNGLADAGIRNVHLMSHSLGVQSLLAVFENKEDGSRSDSSLCFCLDPAFANDNNNISNNNNSNNDMNASAALQAPSSSDRNKVSNTNPTNPNDDDDTTTNNDLLVCKSIIMMNPDFPVDAFVDHAFPSIRRICNHITIIGDRIDKALWWSELLGGVSKYFGYEQPNVLNGRIAQQQQRQQRLYNNNNNKTRKSFRMQRVIGREIDSLYFSDMSSSYTVNDDNFTDEEVGGINDNNNNGYGSQQLDHHHDHNSYRDIDDTITTTNNMVSNNSMSHHHYHHNDDRLLFKGIPPQHLLFPEEQQLQQQRWLDIDVIDTTSLDTNIQDLRHSAFNINPILLKDLEELIITGRRADKRSTLLYREGNIFSYCVAPRYVVM